MTFLPFFAKLKSSPIKLIGHRKPPEHPHIRLTVFMCPDYDRIGHGAVSYRRPGLHPKPVLGELLQLVDHVLILGRVLKLQHDSFGVRFGALDVEDLVVQNLSIPLVLRRRVPFHPDAGRRLRVGLDLLGWSARNCLIFKFPA